MSFDHRHWQCLSVGNILHLTTQTAKLLLCTLREQASQNQPINAGITVSTRIHQNTEPAVKKAQENLDYTELTLHNSCQPMKILLLHIHKQGTTEHITNMTDRSTGRISADLW